MNPVTQPTTPNPALQQSLLAPTTPAPVQSTPIDFSQFLGKTQGAGIPSKTDINPQTGKMYAVNPSTGAFDDNYWANTVEPQLKASSGGGQPTFDVLGATNAAYNTPEILAANQAVSSANTELTTRQQALADAQAEINDNPFYSEATRVGKSAKLTEQANNDMTVIQNKIQEAQGQVASLKADAAIKVNAAMGQYNINRQNYQDSLTNFQNLLSAGALDNASGTDLANLAVQTGIPVSMMQSMQSVSQKKDNPQEKPQLVQATDNQGNLTLLAVGSDGKIINQTTIDGAGKTAKGAAGKTASTGGTTGGGGSTSNKSQIAADKAAAPGSLTTDVKKNKMTLGTAMALYQQYGLSPQKIYSIYKSNTSYNWQANQEADQARYNVK